MKLLSKWLIYVDMDFSIYNHIIECWPRGFNDLSKKTDMDPVSCPLIKNPRSMTFNHLMFVIISLFPSTFQMIHGFHCQYQSVQECWKALYGEPRTLNNDHGIQMNSVQEIPKLFRDV